MINIRDIITKIEKPLLFSSKDDFRCLHLVKDLERSISAACKELKTYLPAEHTSSINDQASSVERLFAGFDDLQLEDKKERVRKALSILASIDVLDNVQRERPTVDVGVNLAADFEKLALPIQFIKGVGPKISGILERKNIHAIEDILYFLPRRYEDRRHVKTIAAAVPGIRETLVGRIIDSRLQQYRHKKVFELTIGDSTGFITATWFKGNPMYMKNVFKKGQEIILTGELRLFNGGKNMIHPDYEVLDEQDDASLHFKRIVPIYSETEGLHQKSIRRIAMHTASDFAACVPSPLPSWIIAKRQLPPIGESINSLHCPPNDLNIELLNDSKTIYHRRLIYDEFFFFELGMALRKKGHVLEQGITFKKEATLIRKFYEILPFNLTAAQNRVIDEIEQDMGRPFPMNRLLQGDVGSGKTVVSMAAMIMACENGYQSAIMAPTEILAEQHFRNICSWSQDLGLKSVLMTGSMKGAARKEAVTAIASGEINIIVGTHALIQDTVNFKQLGFVVIDEQHRYGVMQRAALRAKGQNPDVLVMTATPIPRTLAMTVYGDLDVSVIDELPPGKKPIKTTVFFESQRERVYGIIRGELMKNHQVFIVYPLVEESEILDLKDATRMADQLQNEVFQEYRIGLVHGRMRGRDKDRVMSRFLRKELDILVATTVIEVGIDIPEATMMVVEHAERFGLSQLHQLRGRVGRSDIPSYCILLAQYSGSEEAKKRLQVMERTNDGFRIAEEDLVIRGPGEFMGTRQSGLPDFRVANILRDGRILGEARTDAFAVVDADPALDMPENRELKKVLMHRWHGRLEWAKTG
ncbi:MAG: ATP-dependent DNA helicase RecG [Syntrophus sp. SKADARSKE-3]|nr:ATP-dependent DNA helicase RecG [Syntrophus sp. SKADARSKE-3]